jgi:hypothetical protein
VLAVWLHTLQFSGQPAGETSTTSCNSKASRCQAKIRLSTQASIKYKLSMCADLPSPGGGVDRSTDFLRVEVPHLRTNEAAGVSAPTKLEVRRGKERRSAPLSATTGADFATAAPPLPTFPCPELSPAPSPSVSVAGRLLISERGGDDRFRFAALDIAKGSFLRRLKCVRGCWLSIPASQATPRQKVSLSQRHAHAHAHTHQGSTPR